MNQTTLGQKSKSLYFTISGAIGYICDKDVGLEVPEVMCKMFGFSHGRKLRNFGFVNTDGIADNMVYVLDKMQCQGDETSIFDCQLGPWMLG